MPGRPTRDEALALLDAHVQVGHFAGFALTEEEFLESAVCAMKGR